MAKKLFESNNMSYNEINIEEEGWGRDKLYKITGSMTVPQIVINNKCIGGYDSLVALNQSGQLKKMIHNDSD